MRRRATCRPRLQGVLLLFLCLASWGAVASAEPPGVQYAYDELGRLVAVVDADGNAAIYAYDAVGNLLSIQRVDAATLPGPVAITAVVPEAGKTGTVVSILGTGFGAGAGDNLVAFNGIGAAVAHASTNRITTAVPPGATTGPITVTTPLGSAVSPRPFRVIGAIAVTPAAVSLGAGGAQQFIATDGDAETTRVIWAVDHIVGGDPHVGPISPRGLYTAPATILAPRTVTVTATRTDDASVMAPAVVTLRPPLPLFVAAAAVGVQAADSDLRALVAPDVGVQRAPDGAGITIVATPIGVAPPVRDAFSGMSQVSVSLEPLITSVSPLAAARGTANLTLTLAGFGLAGIIGIEFLLDHAADPALAVADLIATPDGTQATARISIAATAVPGPRVVRISAPAGTTTSVGAGGNVFTVQ
jgi:YD repeat-containing protein